MYYTSSDFVLLDSLSRSHPTIDSILKACLRSRPGLVPTLSTARHACSNTSKTGGSSLQCHYGMWVSYNFRLWFFAKCHLSPVPHLGLHSAAANGDVGLVQYALSHGQPINSVLDGVLPLHAACSGGNDLVVKLLIEKGADVNASR